MTNSVMMFPWPSKTLGTYDWLGLGNIFFHIPDRNRSLGKPLEFCRQGVLGDLPKLLDYRVKKWEMSVCSSSIWPSKTGVLQAKKSCMLSGYVNCSITFQRVDCEFYGQTGENGDQCYNCWFIAGFVSMHIHQNKYCYMQLQKVGVGSIKWRVTATAS